MSKPVLHKSWVKRNGFGGITTTTQCRVFSGADCNGMNVADTDEQVTCKLCLRMIEAGTTRPSVDPTVIDKPRQNATLP